MVDLHELNTIKDARIWWLVSHFELGLVPLELMAAPQIHLCQRLQQHQPGQSLQSRPLLPRDEHIDFFRCLVEAFGVDFFS